MSKLIVSNCKSCGVPITRPQMAIIRCEHCGNLSSLCSIEEHTLHDLILQATLKLKNASAFNNTSVRRKLISMGVDIKRIPNITYKIGAALHFHGNEIGVTRTKTGAYKELYIWKSSASPSPATSYLTTATMSNVSNE